MERDPRTPYLHPVTAKQGFPTDKTILAGRGLAAKPRGRMLTGEVDDRMGAPAGGVSQGSLEVRMHTAEP